MIKQSTPDSFQCWHAPGPADVGEDHIEFLRILEQPTWITLPGADKMRSRAIVTLLHGNEPSGLKAIHSLIKSGIEPATNLGIFIAGVNASLQPPLFSHRFLPEEQDLNRCFNPPYIHNQSKLAKAILDTLRDFSPEAIIDGHNTSAHSEPFAVASVDTIPVRQITCLFTRKLVIVNRKLGALIEPGPAICPTITVEFGGFMEHRADVLAQETLETFARQKDLFDVDPLPLQLLRHPLRLEIEPGYHVHYSSSVQDDADITLFNTIDQLNFSSVPAKTSLGWLGANGMNGLQVMNPKGDNLVHEFFAEDNGFLVTRQPLTLFMATTDPYIAQRDCLLYLCADE